MALQHEPRHICTAYSTWSAPQCRQYAQRMVASRRHLILYRTGATHLQWRATASGYQVCQSRAQCRYLRRRHARGAQPRARLQRLCHTGQTRPSSWRLRPEHQCRLSRAPYARRQVMGCSRHLLQQHHLGRRRLP